MRQNAAQLNRMQIREQEALNRQRRSQDDAEAQREGQAIRRTQAQYDHVTSHGYGRGGPNAVSANSSVAPSASSPLPSASSSSGAAGAGITRGGRRPSVNANVAHGDDVQIKVYVRECDENAGQIFSYREGGAAVSTAASGVDDRSARVLRSTHATPGQRAPARHAGGGNNNNNNNNASSSARSEDGVVAPNRARVPRYLQQRKAEMAAEKEAVAAEAERQRQLSQIPPGHRRVSEEEKADVLRRVDERQHELELQLAKIPIRFDTQSIQQRRRAIEDELRELESKRSKYSTKNPLYVPLS